VSTPEGASGGASVPHLTELPKLVREPAGEPEGGLVLLHGKATDERDLFPLLDELDPDRRLLGFTPGAPITNLPPGGRHWYVIEEVGQPDEESFVQSLNTISRFIDDELRRWKVPWDKTVVGGFSQGAAVSYAVALGMGRPRPAGILGMSGFYPMVRGWKLDAKQKRGLPAYITHGAYDPVIPVGFGRRTRDLMMEGGLYVTYRETRVQHSVDFELMPEMRQWVTAVTSGEPPELIV
jgi:phospholipase/carboxylesterase